MSKTEKPAVATETNATKTPGNVTAQDKAAARQKLEKLADKNKPGKSDKADKEVKSDKAAVAKVAMGVVKYEKALKWKYPEDCVTAKDRKLYRAKMRNQLRLLARELVKMEGAAKEKPKRNSTT